jgi:hypothetical protein
MRYNTHLEERNEEIRRRRREGEMPRQIAKAMGITIGVIVGVCHRAGLSHPANQKEGCLRGEDVGISKLTVEKVRAIRASREPRGKLAAQFGVSPETIYDIVRGKTWKHVI